VPVDTFFLVKSFVTLVVVIDPVAAVPLFLALTAGTSRASATGRHGRRSW
jgi:small neutral amino acid transporter SnatA (MarC family)